ncbi:MAG: AtpZ/AtpI family protein [Stellaceae bacterium]
MSEETPPDPLARLGEKIEQARREQLQRAGKGRGSVPHGPLALAFRIAIELVAALIVGVAIGWGIDWGVERLFGVHEYAGRIVFFFIGAAAGMVNVFRATKELGRTPPSGQQQDRN